MMNIIDNSFIAHASDVLGRVLTDRAIDTTISRLFLTQNRASDFDPQAYGSGNTAKPIKIAMILDNYQYDDQLDILQALCDAGEKINSAAVQELRVYMEANYGSSCENEEEDDMEERVQRLIDEADKIELFRDIYPDREKLSQWVSRIKVFLSDLQHPLKDDLHSNLFHLRMSSADEEDIAEIKGMLSVIKETVTTPFYRRNSDLASDKKRTMQRPKRIMEEKMDTRDMLLKLGQEVLDMSKGCSNASDMDDKMYPDWYAKVTMIANRLNTHPLKVNLCEFLVNPQSAWDNFDYINSFIKTIVGTVDQDSNDIGLSLPAEFDAAPSEERKPLVFISHCEEDKAYSDKLIALFQRTGLPNDLIFSYSSPGHGIPMGGEIYKELKERLSPSNRVFVLYLLTENFYASPDCLNEMGAAWITSQKQLGILIPPFEYKDVRGAIGKSTIHMNINRDANLNELRDEIETFCGVSLVSGNPWETMRNQFIADIESLIATPV